MLWDGGSVRGAKKQFSFIPVEQAGKYLMLSINATVIKDCCPLKPHLRGRYSIFLLVFYLPDVLL